VHLICWIQQFHDPFGDFMDCPITTVCEMPEALHKALAKFINSHPDWDQDRVIAVALSIFLQSQEVAA
jgi:hypothetical protein